LCSQATTMDNEIPSRSALLHLQKQSSRLHEYHLHQPDTDHALLENLECLHDLKTKGVISAIGMSNYHVSEVQGAFDLCEEHSLTPPTVYQGLYNPLNRAVEEELLPVLEHNDCSFVAYNPLAAGLLAGMHTNTASDNTDSKDVRPTTSKHRSELNMY
jgi:aflatoxin B1 aldehyde reductase